MIKYRGFIMCVLCLNLMSLISCTSQNESFSLKGQWILEPNGEVMLDPQTSGLTFWRGKLLSISDGSADKSQQKQLHIIDPASATLAKDSLVMQMSERVENSCFADYLKGAPDLEALTVDPNNDKIFIAVTEDATRSEGLSVDCQKRFANSGSTEYPSLLIRLALIDNHTVLITHVKPIQFDVSYQIGDFPNDGIEGLAYGLNNTLYMALEKDIKGKARIFSVELSPEFWALEDFTRVEDTQVQLPTFETNHHPINGLTYIAHSSNKHKGYLIAAARNDNQLWIIDLTHQTPTKTITLEFLASTQTKNSTCIPWELIGNTSIEGLAYHDGKVWIVNDPWKKHYKDNIQCEMNSEPYHKFAPLLFSMPILEHWLD